ncbi:MAG: single-stranded DNA-binding protein [bacterium]|nr:single-stranded DNA-binding protein [bacterium]
MNFNKVILIGRLTRDPESRALPSGQSVTSFGMATDRFFSDKNGQKQQQTDFHNIVLFGKLAEIASKYLNKGSLVLIEGRLKTRSWKDPAGNNRYRTEIVAERLQMGPKSASRQDFQSQNQEKETFKEGKEDIPVIEEEEIDVKDIPL